MASTPWKMALNNAVAFMVGHGNNTFVAMERIGSFYDAEQAINPGITGLGSIPADDVDGWIAANGILVEAREEVTVGGRVAQYRQIRIPADAGDQTCANPPCIAMVSSSADLDASPTFLFSELPHSFWFVDMGEFEPLGIWAYTAEPDHQAWLDELAPLIDSIVLGEPGPAVKNGTARVPLRVTVSAAYSGVRTDGAVLADGSIPVTYNATSEGTMTGEIVGTGTYVPGVETTGSDEYTFTGTIDGIGTGTLTYTDEWTATGPAESTITTAITGGTGDFVGVTGTGTSTVDTSDKVGADDTVTGTNAFDLVVPRSG